MNSLLTPHIILPPAIVLAGGLGTRLRSVVQDLPKPMAPVNGKPFLHHVLSYLYKQGIEDVVLSVGYKADLIERYFGDSYLGMNIRYSREEEPLGTGGAIKQAFALTGSEAFILNGDTYFDVPLNGLYQNFVGSKTHAVLAAKPMKNFDRYGSLILDDQNNILAFQEKKSLPEGMINGGVYCVSRSIFSVSQPGHKFSFEKEVLEKHVTTLQLRAFICDGYFIDIGIPEDYQRAQHDFV